MKCFYHTDGDGWCSGAIVHKFFKVDRDFTKEIGEECLFIPINYNNEFPFESIIKNETIVIVDFSLQKEGEFDRLKQISDKIIWIDHHKTAIEKHKHIDADCAGIRKDGVAACILTWQYFYPGTSIPKIVDMLGAYDIWDFSKYGEDLNKLQTGIRLFDHKPESAMWNKWLSEDAEAFMDVINKGSVALQYRDNVWAGQIKAWSFFAEFEGYKAVCCNAGSVSSQLFDSVKEDYDIMIPFVFDGKRWTVSIYTKKDIDCSEIAKKFGGGGHKKAAGFQCEALPFII